jgi:hypothetical protein
MLLQSLTGIVRNPVTSYKLSVVVYVGAQRVTKDAYTNLDLGGLSFSQHRSSRGEIADWRVLENLHTERCAQLVN